MLKSYGWWVGGGPCDFCVSPSPFGLDFGTLDFGTLDSGLTIVEKDSNHKRYPEKGGLGGSSTVEIDSTGDIQKDEEQQNKSWLSPLLSLQVFCVSPHSLHGSPATVLNINIKIARSFMCKS